MPYIHQVSDAEAQGAVKRELDRARQRAGRVWNIVRINDAQSPGATNLYGLLQRPDVCPVAAQPGAT